MSSLRDQLELLESIKTINECIYYLVRSIYCFSNSPDRQSYLLLRAVANKIIKHTTQLMISAESKLTDAEMTAVINELAKPVSSKII